MLRLQNIIMYFSVHVTPSNRWIGCYSVVCNLCSTYQMLIIAWRNFQRYHGRCFQKKSWQKISNIVIEWKLRTVRFLRLTERQSWNVDFAATSAFLKCSFLMEIVVWLLIVPAVVVWLFVHIEAGVRMQVGFVFRLFRILLAYFCFVRCTADF